jgi:molybdopterin-guanine dinucleotide biosynthesis protein A
MTAIILAGGKSLRMGSNKALLRYGSSTFIEQQIAILKNIFDEILISADNANEYERLHLPIVQDIMPDMGPLSGICSGLMRAASFHSFVVACDMPFINEKLILYLREQINSYDVVVPQTSLGLEPMHAFYSKNCIEPICRCIEKGRLKITDFFPEVKVKIIEEKDYKELETFSKSVINLNTPEEYKKHCQ